jgi:hypothetical protein
MDPLEAAGPHRYSLMLPQENKRNEVKLFSSGVTFMLNLVRISRVFEKLTQTRQRRRDFNALSQVEQVGINKFINNKLH